MSQRDPADAPDVPKHESALGDEVPLVPIVLTRRARCTQRADRAPSQRLADTGADVRQIVPVGECGRAVATDDGVDLGLGARLHLGVEHHREHKDDQLSGSLRFKMRVEEIHVDQGMVVSSDVSTGGREK